METQDDLLQLLLGRLRLAKAFCKDTHDNWKKHLKDYKIETVVEAIKNSEQIRSALQIPYIFTTVESELPSIFDKMPELIITGKGKRDKELGQISNSIYDYLKEKLALEEKIEDDAIYYSLIGFAVERIKWETKTKKVKESEVVNITDESGNVVENQEVLNEYNSPVKDDPDTDTVNPFKMYFSPESKFTVEGDKIPYLFEETSLTPDEVKEYYDKEIESDSSLDLSDYEVKEEDFKGEAKDDLKRVKVFKYYGTIPQKLAPEKSKWSCEKVYHIDFYSKEILKKEENPYKSKPYRFLGNYGIPLDFFKFGEARVLRLLEQELSLRRSQMVDYADRFANPKTIVPTTTTFDEKAWKDPSISTIARYDGQQPPAYVIPPEIPAVVIQAERTAREDLQMVSRTLEITRGGNQSIVKTATGQSIFAEAAEKKYRRSRKKIGRFIKSIVRFLLELALINYPEEKVFLITDQEGNDQEIDMATVKEKMAGYGSIFDIDILPETVTSNKDVLRAQAIDLYDRTKDDLLINRQEIIKDMLTIGFDRKDTEKYIKQPLVPPGSVLFSQDGQVFIIGPDGMPQPPQEQAPQPTMEANVPSSYDQIAGQVQRQGGI